MYQLVKLQFKLHGK